MNKNVRTLGMYALAAALCVYLALQPTAGTSVSPLILKWLAIAALIIIVLRGAAEIYLRMRPEDNREHGGIVKPHDADETWPRKSRKS